MMHRFAHPERGVTGHDPAMLRRALEYLRAESVPLVSVSQLLEAAFQGADISAAVAFTVDDGYVDFHEVAAPIFLEYDCPVTVFLVTDFLDGPSWMWWDRVRRLFLETSETEVEVRLPEGSTRLDLRSETYRDDAASRLVGALAPLPRSRRDDILADLELRLGSALPAFPTPEFEPLTWDQVRGLEAAGVSFGPHTLTHPDLAQLSASEGLAEVSGSWNRLIAELESPEPIFCYPYGQARNLSSEVQALPADAGLRGAVTAVQTHATAIGLVADPFRVPRFGWPDTFLELRNITAGLSRAKNVLLKDR